MGNKLFYSVERGPDRVQSHFHTPEHSPDRVEQCFGCLNAVWTAFSVWHLVS